ncbi:hypothetical protein [Bacillus sp. 2205SS5-2]|uniref:hypothetical protein n=1 Tax=Bacillus sp. 2205SS5-2 TaxID=3109031 RepID=UPI003005EA9F
MDKRTTRAFSMGLFIAAVLLLGLQLGSKETKLEIQDLKKQGYIVLTEDEYTSMNEKFAHLEEKLAQSQEQKTEKPETAKEENTEKPEVSKEEKNTDEKETTTFTLSIKSGMTSFEIAETLAQQKIVQDEDDFRTFLNENKHAEEIQIGEYEVSSDMDYLTLAKIITKTN